MGKRGPKKTPTAILKIRGSRRANERPDRAVVAEMPEPPGWLTGEALEMWNELAPILFDAGVLTLRDRHALARLCKMRIQYRQCVEFTDKHGMTFHGKDLAGNLISKRHAETIEQRNLAPIIARLESAFGLEPSSRAGGNGLPADTPKPKSVAAYKRA